MSHKKFGSIGSAVLTFIGYKQTDKQTNKPNLYLYLLTIHISVAKSAYQIFNLRFLFTSMLSCDVCLYVCMFVLVGVWVFVCLYVKLLFVLISEYSEFEVRSPYVPFYYMSMPHMFPFIICPCRICFYSLATKNNNRFCHLLII